MLLIVYRVAQKLAPFLYSLALPNIKRFSKFYLLFLLSVPSDVSNVIGIWSVLFESFVCLFLFVYKDFFVTMRVERLTSDIDLFTIVA